MHDHKPEPKRCVICGKLLPPNNKRFCEACGRPHLMTSRRAFLAAAFGVAGALALPKPQRHFRMQKFWLDGQLHTFVNGQLIESTQVAECPWVIVPAYERNRIDFFNPALFLPASRPDGTHS